MNEKKQKKETYDSLRAFGYSHDDAKKTAYQVLTLQKDMKSFDNPSVKESFQAFKETFQNMVAAAFNVPLGMIITDKDVEELEQSN